MHYPPEIVYFRCCGCHYYEGNFNYFEQVAAGRKLAARHRKTALKS